MKISDVVGQLVKRYAMYADLDEKSVYVKKKGATVLLSSAVKFS